MHATAAAATAAAAAAAKETAKAAPNGDELFLNNSLTMHIHIYTHIYIIYIT